MRNDLYQESFEQETYYWWHIAKQKLVSAFLKKYLKEKRIRVLDIGCGTGGMLNSLKTLAFVCGVDKSETALKFAKKRGLKNLIKHDFAKNRLPIKDSSYHAVLALDVLEHLKNPDFVLEEISRILKPGGILIVIVPAYKFLWSYWDEVLGHYTRYSKKEIASLLEKEGYYSMYSSYFHSTILPLATLARFIKQKIYNFSKKINEAPTDLRPGFSAKGDKNEIHSDFRPLPNWLNNFLNLISSFERLLLSRGTLPFGLSIITISKKNGSKKS